MPGKGELFLLILLLCGSLIPIVIIGMRMVLPRLNTCKPKVLWMVNAKEAIPKRHKAFPGDCRLRLPPIIKIAWKTTKSLEISAWIW